jgi:hypothetical protein
MASMNQIGHPNNDSVSKYMQDIVGANMGFIFTNAAKKTDEAQTVIAMIRDKIKSVLARRERLHEISRYGRQPGQPHDWYPDPSNIAAAAVQCLQPRSLRLVRPRQLGFSGLRLLR